jgi:hypothetical protein
MVKSLVWTAISRAGDVCKCSVDKGECEERMLACATGQMAGLTNKGLCFVLVCMCVYVGVFVCMCACVGVYVLHTDASRTLTQATKRTISLRPTTLILGRFLVSIPTTNHM